MAENGGFELVLLTLICKGVAEPKTTFYALYLRH